MHSMPVVPDSGGDIFDHTQRGDVEQCANFIQNDPSIVKQKGWGGFCPLHYAALHGNRALVDLFLRNGADPNQMSEAGQSCFHFACRQGNIYIIHQMMQYEADARLIDLQGKTSLHHAVTGGSIVAVHYLWETGMFHFSDTDMYQTTPLHMAASTGNIEVVRYLLRNQRCAVDAIDQQGATALHVAAERGVMEVCWMLLQTSGCWTLHKKTVRGLTPLDLSRQGNTLRHQQLSKLLRRYVHEPMHHKPKESDALYYWSLFFPTLTGAAILLIAAMLGDYSGIICTVLFPWLARSIFTQYHRMATYQRSPNPVYLGTLIAGVIHSLLCFYGKIMYYILHKDSRVEVSLVHLTVVLGLFLKILIQDPGTLDRADADPNYSCIADLVEKNQSPQRFCPYCELFHPDYSKHCKLCEVCIKDYDHHCLFLNRCIGRGNHRLFLVFIFSLVTAHLLFLASAIMYLYESLPVYGNGLSVWLTMLGIEFWVAAMTALNVLTLLWELWLITEQFDAISAGSTTYFRQCETVAVQKSLGQRCLTVLVFLLEGRRQVGKGQTRVDKSSIDV
ncbi:uncharacterized protein LOC143013156 [Genypterus blacodes]|uniref:uncharacterized protein LOC143013156 n=1 Tax=Genypterus blacodes TaxID=154954 RepID=UPI003F759EED